jgi:hypothetical protein
MSPGRIVRRRGCLPESGRRYSLALETLFSHPECHVLESTHARSRQLCKTLVCALWTSECGLPQYVLGALCVFAWHLGWRQQPARVAISDVVSSALVARSPWSNAMRRARDVACLAFDLWVEIEEGGEERWMDGRQVVVDNFFGGWKGRWIDRQGKEIDSFSFRCVYTMRK